MENLELNQKILEELKGIRIDINIIKENIAEDVELTDWAENELAEARAETKTISHEEVKKMILGK
jgi:hypothetical protein